MTGHGDTSKSSSYRRLFVYTRPYAGRLAIGIVAGILAGSSLYGLLQMAPRIVKPFSRSDTVSEADTASDTGNPAPITEDTVGWVERSAHKLGIPVKKGDGTMSWQFMALTLVALPLLVGLRAFADYLNRYYVRWVGARTVRALRDDMFDRVQSQSLKFFGRCDVGKLISRCTNDTTVIETVMSTAFVDVVRAPIEIIAAVSVVLVVSIGRGFFDVVAVMFLVFPLLVLPIIVLGRYVRRYTRRALERISQLVSRMHETFTGIRAVKAFDMGKKESARFAETDKAYFGSMVSALKSELFMTPLMEAVGIVLIGVFFVVCYARDVQLEDIFTIGLASIVVYRPLKQLARVGANLQRGKAALERVFELMDTDTLLTEREDATVVDGFEDSIEFDHVSFAYDEDGSQVLSDISLALPRGKVLALVGETGSGKTTIANLLARFYDPTEGNVTLDGRDLRDVRIASLRRLIGVVTQETILFNDTIAANIAYGSGDVSKQAIEDAARKANAHEFIADGPEGYERMCGEKGFVLSGGERQRIAIARAILKNPPVLILDEATSALDTITERLVQEAIARVMAGRTVLAIAHRLSTVKHADEIVLLDKGKIVERGSHDELYAAAGRYRTLCDMQVLD